MSKVAQWKAQSASTQRVKAFRLMYKVRLHVRPDPDDLPAVKLTYLQVLCTCLVKGDCLQRSCVRKHREEELGGDYRHVA